MVGYVESAKCITQNIIEGGIEVQDITYTELVALQSGGTLNLDRVYRLTDFRTRNQLAISAAEGFNEADVEVLLLRPDGVSSISPVVTSESFPDDFITYRSYAFQA